MSSAGGRREDAKRPDGFPGAYSRRSRALGRLFKNLTWKPGKIKGWTLCNHGLNGRNSAQKAARSPYKPTARGARIGRFRHAVEAW